MTVMTASDSDDTKLMVVMITIIHSNICTILFAATWEEPTSGVDHVMM